MIKIVFVKEINSCHWTIAIKKFSTGKSWESAVHEPFTP